MYTVHCGISPCAAAGWCADSLTMRPILAALTHCTCDTTQCSHFVHGRAHHTHLHLTGQCTTNPADLTTPLVDLCFARIAAAATSRAACAMAAPQATAMPTGNMYSGHQRSGTSGGGVPFSLAAAGAAAGPAVCGAASPEARSIATLQVLQPSNVLIMVKTSACFTYVGIANASVHEHSPRAGVVVPLLHTQAGWHVHTIVLVSLNTDRY